MNVDGIFLKGRSHHICEDYMLYGTEPFPYIIISDGCSSSKNTDVGARILAHTTRRNIKTAFDYSYKEFGMLVAALSKASIQSLGLSTTAMDATLIMVAYINGMYNVRLYGDGSIFYDSRYLTLDYTGNAPYYLSYWVDRERANAFLDKFGSYVTLIENSEGFTQKNTIDIDETFFVFSKFLADVKSDRPNHPLLIASDGIEQISTLNKQTMDAKTMAKAFTNFKTTKGEFVKRRVLREMKNQEKQGYYSMDDLSVGCIID